MDSIRIVMSAAAIVLVSAAAAQAQYARTADIGMAEETEDDELDRNVFGPVGVNVGGAIALPVSDSGSRFDPGGGFTAGLTLNPHPMFGLQGEYMFSRADVEGDVLENATQLDGHQTLQYGDLNVVVRPVKRQRFGFYVLGGPGIYNRHVEVDEIAGTGGAAELCDPWLLACSAAAVPPASLQGEADSLDFGVNGGFGVYAVVAPPLRMYLEARYHYIWGPEFTTPEGETVTADGQYVPVVLGLAF